MDYSPMVITNEVKALSEGLNKPPRDTFIRHYPGYRNELSEDKRAENELYDAWLASLKPGDVVYYDYYSGWRGGRTFTEVKSITKTGMIRLKDGKLVENNGRVKGESRFLQPYTEDYSTFDKRKHVLYKLSNMDFKNFTNEGLAVIIRAIAFAEELVIEQLPKSVEDGERGE